MNKFLTVIIICLMSFPSLTTDAQTKRKSKAPSKTYAVGTPWKGSCVMKDLGPDFFWVVQFYTNFERYGIYIYTEDYKVKVGDKLYVKVKSPDEKEEVIDLPCSYAGLDRYGKKYAVYEIGELWQKYKTYIPTKVRFPKGNGQYAETRLVGVSGMYGMGSHKQVSFEGILAILSAEKAAKEKERREEQERKRRLLENPAYGM